MAENLFKLQLLARAELAVKDVQARRALARTSYLGFALVLFLLALGMLNLAGFLAFEELLSPPGAAFAMALINTVGVLLVLQVSKRAGPSEREEALAREIREMAYQQVNQDVEEVKEKLEHLGSEVSRIGENVNRATGAVRFLLSALGKGK